MRSIAAKRRGHRILHRDVAAQPAVRQFSNRRPHVVESRRAADAHPAGAPAGRKVGLRETRERDDGGIGIEDSQWFDPAGVAEIAVDLVGENHQAVPIGQVEQPAADGGGIGGARRVVGIDDDQRARGRRDEAVDVIEVGRPSARRVGAIEPRARAELRQHRRVQRIRRHRHEHIAFVVDDRAQRQLDRFRRAGGDEDAVGGDRESAGRVLVGDGFTGVGEAGRRPVSVVAVAHRALHRLDQRSGRLESERDGIANVEIAHRFPLRFDAPGFRDDVADGVGKAADSAGDREWAGREMCGCHGEILQWLSATRSRIATTVVAPGPGAAGASRSVAASPAMTGSRRAPTARSRNRCLQPFQTR